MTLEQKNRAIFSSRFINDTEENIQATEELIKKYHIGVLFSIVEPVLPLIMRLRKIVFNDDSYQRLKDLTARYQNALLLHC
jgi:hypothetical protein